MARASTASAAGPRGGLDKTGAAGMQGRPDPARHGQSYEIDEVAAVEDWSEGAVHRGRLRVRTLVTLRWLVVGGETALLLAVLSFGFALPYALCFTVVGVGAWINL